MNAITVFTISEGRVNNKLLSFVYFQEYCWIRHEVINNQSFILTDIVYVYNIEI